MTSRDVPASTVCVCARAGEYCVRIWLHACPCLVHAHAVYWLCTYCACACASACALLHRHRALTLAKRPRNGKHGPVWKTGTICSWRAADESGLGPELSDGRTAIRGGGRAGHGVAIASPRAPVSWTCQHVGGVGEHTAPLTNAYGVAGKEA